MAQTPPPEPQDVAPQGSGELIREIARLNAEFQRLTAETEALHRRAEALAKEASQLQGTLKHERHPADTSPE